MLFNSFGFMLGFLPATLAGFLLIGKTVETPVARMLWLAAASLVFYGYWNVKFLPVIAISMIGNFLLATAIARFPRASRAILVVAVVLNLAALGYYKYAGFAIGIVNSVSSAQLPALSVVLPLGISFFTFTQIAYLADVAAGRAYERDFVKYVLFVTYFPHLIAGPIMHHRQMMPQFGARPRDLSYRLAVGLSVFGIGLCKKAVVADWFATIADPVFKAAATGPVPTSEAWAGALAYSLQIYFDFSGYCDMAIGISFLFGIVLPFNFDAPYKSQSIGEFWHRWHITLSRFLRDYVYIPLGGNRRGEARRHYNLALTMLVGGLWHGAGWTFVIWGGLHGLFLIVNHAWARLVRRLPALAAVAETAPYALLSLLLTQVCVVVAWVYFRADSLAVAHGMLGAMSGWAAASPSPTPLVSVLDAATIAAGYLGCLLLPNVNEMFRAHRVGLDTYSVPPRFSVPRLGWGASLGWGAATAALLGAAVVAMLAAGDSTPFLYFQF